MPKVIKEICKSIKVFIKIVTTIGESMKQLSPIVFTLLGEGEILSTTDNNLMKEFKVLLHPRVSPQQSAPFPYTLLLYPLHKYFYFYKALLQEL
jgi:hypothetical protein